MLKIKWRAIAKPMLEKKQHPVLLQVLLIWLVFMLHRGRHAGRFERVLFSLAFCSVECSYAVPKQGGTDGSWLCA